MDETGDSRQDSLRNLTKARVIGKLFGKDKKPPASNDDDISAFLHGPSDKLYMTGSAPLKLPKIDTSQASRWPTTVEVIRTRDSSRGRSVSPKRSKKGLIVRFTETQPEIIGEGGDDADSPTLEISERKRSNSYPTVMQRHTQSKQPVRDVSHDNRNNVMHGPPIVPRIWAHSSKKATSGIQATLPPRAENRKEPDDRSMQSIESQTAKSLEITSPIARAQADMRRAEGEAFKRASMYVAEPTNDLYSNPAFETRGLDSAPKLLPVGLSSQPKIPVPLIPGLRPPNSSDGEISTEVKESPPTAVPVSDANTLDDFSGRVQHLFKLFQLSAESVVPLGVSTFEALVRAASWWYMRGKATLDNAIRMRLNSSEAWRNHDNLQLQAHTDLAKCLWIVKEVISQRAELKMHSTEDVGDLVALLKNEGNTYLADLLERCQVITMGLKDITAFMRHQDLFPPPAEETLLPQGLDTSIWIQYPSFGPELAKLLSYNGKQALSTQGWLTPIKMSDAMPLTDTQTTFEYARMFVEVFLVEQGMESQQNQCPSILFVSRARTEKDLKITISSQDGLVSLLITSTGLGGPTWNDLNWQSRFGVIEVKLSKGFVARVQCSLNDYKTIWNMYDYTIKVHASLQPRKDEHVIFEKTVKTFQYFDTDRQNRVFPKELIAHCQVRVFEKSVTKATSAGTCMRHCGLRIAVITGTSTKTLSGVYHDLPTQKPIEYGFMRGEGGAPAMLLKFDQGTKKPSMVMTFDEVSTRSYLHRCITGGAGNGEAVMAYIPLKEFSMATLSAPDVLSDIEILESVEWQGIQVINQILMDSIGLKSPKTIQSDHLRVIMDSKSGCFTDRMNIEPGSLKIRLSTQMSKHDITIIRNPQEDMTLSILEAQVSREVFKDMAGMLEKIAESQTVRKYSFPKIEDVHLFQRALTGFSVDFDGLVESLSISRRRTVVPLYKKWEASLVRLQILRQDEMVQLAAFFDNFSHGECMNFALKATDAFESFNRSGKYCIRIVDANFAVPKGEGEGIHKGFICVDLPDYPLENDDITLILNSEADRDRLAKALPAPAKTVSRLGTIKR